MDGDTMIFGVPQPASQPLSWPFPEFWGNETLLHWASGAEKLPWLPVRSPAGEAGPGRLSMLWTNLLFTLIGVWIAANSLISHSYVTWARLPLHENPPGSLWEAGRGGGGDVGMGLSAPHPQGTLLALLAVGWPCSLGPSWISPPSAPLRPDTQPESPLLQCLRQLISPSETQFPRIWGTLSWKDGWFLWIPHSQWGAIAGVYLFIRVKG